MAAGHTGPGSTMADMKSEKTRRFADYYDIASFFPARARDSTIR